MIRALRFILLGLLALGLMTVALANRATVTVRLLPDDLAAVAGGGWSAEVPLFLVMFGGIVTGLLIGFVWEWLRESKHRSAANATSREVSRLERELAVMRDAGAVPPKDEVLALLERPKGA